MLTGKLTKAGIIAAGAFIVGVALATGNAQASITLGDLFDGNPDYLVVGDKVFDEWKLGTFDTNTGTDLYEIGVVPLDDQPLNPGLKFIGNGQLAATSGGESVKMYFSYVVTSSGPKIKDNSLEITNYLFEGPGNIYSDEEVQSLEGDRLGFKDVWAYAWYNDPDELFYTLDLSDSVDFQPQESIWVGTYVLVESDGCGLVELEELTQRFSQVPEPSTLIIWSLLGALGITVGWWRRRRKA